MDYLMSRSIIVKEHVSYYLTHSWEDKMFHGFPKGINLKIKFIEQLELEHTCYPVTVQLVNYYVTPPPHILCFPIIENRRTL